MVLAAASDVIVHDMLCKALLIASYNRSNGSNNFGVLFELLLALASHWPFSIVRFVMLNFRA